MSIDERREYFARAREIVARATRDGLDPYEVLEAWFPAVLVSAPRRDTFRVAA